MTSGEDAQGHGQSPRRRGGTSDGPTIYSCAHLGGCKCGPHRVRFEAKESDRPGARAPSDEATHSDAAKTGASGRKMMRHKQTSVTVVEVEEEEIGVPPREPEDRVSIEARIDRDRSRPSEDDEDRVTEQVGRAPDDLPGDLDLKDEPGLQREARGVRGGAGGIGGAEGSKAPRAPDGPPDLKDEPGLQSETRAEAKARDERVAIVDASPEEEAAVRRAIRAASYSEDRVRTICESLLFVSDKPVSAAAVQAVTGIEPRRVHEAMETIAGRFREGVSGVVLHEVAGGWQLRSCPTNAEDVRRFLQVKPQRLTRAALETLAIVAYRQPVTRPEIEDIRGVDSGAVLKALLDRGVVQVIGKKEEPGRPLLYATTKAFLELFNLKDLASLPTLRELHELTEESARIVEESFPEEESRKDRGIADLVAEALSSSLEESRNEDESAIGVLDDAMKAVDRAVRGSTQALESTSKRDEAE